MMERGTQQSSFMSRYTLEVTLLIASWLMMAGLVVPLGIGVNVTGWTGIGAGRGLRRVERRGLDFGVGML